MADLRVDRYDVDLSGTTGTISITDVGDTSRAFVRLMGSTKQDSAGPVGASNNQAPDDVGVRLELTATDTISYTKQLSNTVKVMIEVVSYTGSPGGPHEFISRQRGTVTVSGSSATASISGMTSRDQCIPIYTGFTTSENSNSDFEQATLGCHINTSDEIVFSRNNSGTTITAAYDVVEFIGSAWSVGCARSASHDTGNTFPSAGEVVTMNTASNGVSGSTFDVTSWGQAWIVQATMEGDASETGLSDTMIYALPGPSSTELRLTLDNTNSRNDGTAYAYVLHNADLSVVRDTNTNVPEGNNSYGSNLSAPSGYNYATPLTEMALEWYPGTNGEGTAHLRGALHAKIIDTGSAYQVRHWIHRSGNNVKASYGFVDFSALEDTGPGVVTGTLSATEGTDAASATGSVEVQGALSSTEGMDSASSAGSVVVQGALSLTEAADTAALSGGAITQGVIALTEAPDTAAATGAVLIAGTLSVTEALDTMTSQGGAVAQGDLSVTDAPDSASAAGEVRVAGQLGLTEAADSAAATGAVLVAGAIDAAESVDTAALEGGVVVQGALSSTGAVDTVDGTGAVLVQGALGAAEASGEALSGSGVVFFPPRIGPLAASEAPDIAVFEGTIGVSGTLSATEESDIMKGGSAKPFRAIAAAVAVEKPSATLTLIGQQVVAKVDKL